TLSALLGTWRATPNFVTVDVAQAAFSAPQFIRMTSWPHAVLDLQNGKLAQPFYANAGIPQTQAVAVPAGGPAFTTYVFKAPTALTPCDDLFVLPHADPTWATHSNLIPFNASGGAIW